MIDDSTDNRPSGCVAAVDFDLLLVAAGLGERLGREIPKGMVPLAGAPMFLHSLRVFAGVAALRRAIVAGPPDPAHLRDMRAAAEGAAGTGAGFALHVIPGGARRQDSVREGLRFLAQQGADPAGIVLIHDAARPLLAPDLVRRCLAAMTEAPAQTPDQAPDQAALPGITPIGPWGPGPAGVIPGTPVRETLKLVYEGRIVLTQPRENLYAAQTPQAFRLGPLLEAHDRAVQRRESASDDAALLEWQGIPVSVIQGQVTNLKVTYPEDHELAERLLLSSAASVEGAL